MSKINIISLVPCLRLLIWENRLRYEIGSKTNYKCCALRVSCFIFKFQVFQLKRIIVKLTGQASSDAGEIKVCKKSGKARPFDFLLYKKRHVLLQVAYFGWDFCGFALQVISFAQQYIEPSVHLRSVPPPP